MVSTLERRSNKRNARADNNPYKPVPRTKVFYCDPYLLGKKFKRHTDKVILRKAGVTK